MEWTRLPFVRFGLMVVAGILLGYFQWVSCPTSVILFFASLIIFFLLRLLPVKFRLRLQYLNSLLIFSMFVFIGIFCLHIAIKQNHIPEADNVQAYKAGIISPISDYSGGKKALAKITAVKKETDWEHTDAQIILYFREYIPKTGQELLIVGKPVKPQPALNPGQFDYAAYLYAKGIFYVDFPDQRRILSEIPFYSFSATAGVIHEKIRSELNKHLESKTARSIITGMLLGNKSGVNDEIKNAFSRSGLAHLLAVSGFHVGLLFTLLEILFGFLKKRGNTGKLLFFLTMFMVISFYAFISGLSPSVTRASVMIFIFLLTTLSNKYFNNFHCLFITGTLLLLFDPLSLFDPGFQLSFAAVLGIFLFFAPLNKCFNPKSRILRHIWQACAISLSAQTLTFPLVLYYFHSFPVYFLLSNVLLLVPALLIVYGAFFLLLVLPFESLANLTGHVLSIMTENFYFLLKQMTRLPNPLSSLFPDNFQIILIFLSFLIFTWLFYSRKLFNQYLLLSVVIALSIYTCLKMRDQKRQQKLIVFHCKTSPVAAFIRGNSALLISFSQLNSDSKEFKFNISDFLKRSGISKYSFKQIGSKQSVTFLDKKILFSSRLNTMERGDYIICNILTKNTLTSNIKTPIILNKGFESWIKSSNLNLYFLGSAGAFIKNFK